jgi:hypothetical protein
MTTDLVPEFTLIVDSCVVRKLGELSEPDWSHFLRGWRTSKQSTAWLPRVVSEVAGTNLDWQAEELTEERLELIVQGIRRFDELTNCGPVLPNDHEILRRGLYELAGVDLPPKPCDGRPGQPKDWRQIIELAKNLDSVRP